MVCPGNCVDGRSQGSKQGAPRTGPGFHELKTAVTIRIDQQVLKRFKAKGPGYQTRINALLRAYMEAHKF